MTTHTTRVRSFSAAGDRSHRAECSCGWHGVTTTDKDRAQGDADVGLSDSYERYYQAIRRCYRYGQTREVVAHVILSDLEAPIADNVTRKERQAATFTAELVEAMKTNQHWIAA